MGDAVADRKILIAGGTGFIGSFLSNHFTAQGLAVVALGRNPKRLRLERPNLSFRKCDVRDRAGLETIFRQEKPTHVLHLAFLVFPDHDPEAAYQVDVVGSQNVFEAAKATASVRRFMLFRSTRVYGGHADNPEWLTEEDPMRPRDYLYAVNKKIVEQWIDGRTTRKSMRRVILRPCAIVGPTDVNHGTVYRLEHLPAVPRVGKKCTAVQCVHEEDVMGLMDHVIRDEQIAGTFNLCVDTRLSAQEIGRVLGKPVWYIPVPLLRVTFWLVHKLRLAKFSPAQANLVAYPIIATPAKLVGRYGYAFKYSAAEAFADTVRKRRRRGTL